MSLLQISPTPSFGTQYDYEDSHIGPKGHAPVQAEALTQDKNVTCILPWRVDLPLLVLLKHQCC